MENTQEENRCVSNEEDEEDEEEGTGRKKRSIWSHMTMYDEGMMDEGAASLRDRDMIAGKRGGPSVHVHSVFSFFRTRLARPRVFRPSCASNATHARTNAPLSLV